MLKLLLWILRDYLTRLNSLVTIRTRASISLRSCNSVFGHPHYMPTRLQPRHQSTYIFLDLSIEQAFRFLLFATAAVFLLVAWLKLSNVFIRKIMSSMLSNFFNCVFSFRVIISRALIRQFFIRHIDLDNFTKHCILLMVIHWFSNWWRQFTSLFAWLVKTEHLQVQLHYSVCHCLALLSISSTQLISITAEFNILRCRLSIVSIFDTLFWPITSGRVTPEEDRFKGEWFFRSNISRAGKPNHASQRRFCRH